MRGSIGMVSGGKIVLAARRSAARRHGRADQYRVTQEQNERNSCEAEGGGRISNLLGIENMGVTSREKNGVLSL